MKEKYKCPSFLKAISWGSYLGQRPLPYNIKPKKKEICNDNNVFRTVGWICPKCDAGLSPFTSVCPCNQSVFK